jgi:LmbE family N-acetylglucosaminyl deacetylase
MPVFTDLDPKIVLGVAAHPDDLDFHAGGSLAKWAANGAEVYLLVLTRGNRGTPDPSLSEAEVTALREVEQRTAAAIMGLKDVFFVGFGDCELENNEAVRRVIVSYIRRLKPDVVVCWDPTFVYSVRFGINHPDHRAAGQATLDSVYPLARDHKSFPDLPGPHPVGTVLMVHADADNWAQDITGYTEVKTQALEAHASQGGLQIGLAALEAATATGQAFGLQTAEAFVRLDLPH